MPFNDRLDAAARAGDEVEARRLLGGAGRAKMAELALTQRLPGWLAALVRQEKERRERKAVADPLDAAIACPTFRRLRRLPDPADEYSRLTLTDLRRRLAPAAREEVAAGWTGANHETLAAVYRWVLRGLPPALACRKVHLSGPKRGPRAGGPGLSAAAPRSLSPSRGQVSGAGPKAETAGAPAWVGSLAGVVAASLMTPAPKEKLGFRYREAEGRWEVNVCPTPGEPAGVAFFLDLRRLQAAFNRVDRLAWNARGAGTGDDRSHLCVEGLFGGHEVRLRVMAGASEG